MATNKGKRKTVYDPFRAMAVKSTMEKFECTVAYVYQVISGTATSGKAEEMKAFYASKYAALKQAASTRTNA